LEPEGITLGDFNGSGNLSLVTADYPIESVAVLPGNGNGTFQADTTDSTNGEPYWTAAGDFNGDGILDLAVSNYGGGTVAVLLGNGNGTFKAAVTYTVGTYPTGIVVGDFNKDGNLDIAVVNDGDSTVSILLGNGDGTFQPQLVNPTGVEPILLTVADFNADGNLDLAVGNILCYNLPCPPGTVSLLFGNGDGTFQPHVDYRFGVQSFAPASANLSGEGGADLAVSNLESSTVSVLLNLPVVSVFPNTLNFGKEGVGVKSSALTINISNPSGTPISISGKPKISGADATDFAETTTCPLSPHTLAPGAECSVSVTFDPKATGARSATLSLKDNVPGSPQAIALGGTGN
jgi:hypothetical protein